MKRPAKPSLDKVGICTSAFCAVHCIITPFLIVLLPFTSFAFLETESFEMSLLVFSLFLAGTSITFSYFKSHRNSTPILLVAIGFVFFGLGKIFHLEEVEIAFSIAGGGFVVFAHYRNIKLNRLVAAQE